MQRIMVVISQSPIQTITKADGKTFSKSTLVLRESRDEFDDSYVVPLIGEMANRRFIPGHFYAVQLRFQTRDYNGQTYQDIYLRDVIPIDPSDYQQPTNLAG